MTNNTNPTPKVLTKPNFLIKNAVETVPIIEPTNCEVAKKPDCSSFRFKLFAKIGIICPNKTVTIPTIKKLKCNDIFSSKLFDWFS